jgi:ribonuclease HII
MPVHQADEKFTVVGAASILAKTASDKQYIAFRKQYGDFGSGRPGDPATRFFVWKHRKNPLPIIMVSWQTYKQLSKLESIHEDVIVSKRGKKILAYLSKGGARKRRT